MADGSGLCVHVPADFKQTGGCVTMHSGFTAALRWSQGLITQSEMRKNGDKLLIG